MFNPKSKNRCRRIDGESCALIWITISVIDNTTIMSVASFPHSKSLSHSRLTEIIIESQFSLQINMNGNSNPAHNSPPFVSTTQYGLSYRLYPTRPNIQHDEIEEWVKIVTWKDELANEKLCFNYWRIFIPKVLPFHKTINRGKWIK